MAQEIILTPLDMAYLPQMLAIMDLSYQSHHQESEEVLQIKIGLSGRHGSVALCGDQVCGYLLAYPAPADYLSAIDSASRPQSPCTSLYIHDMAIHPEYRGRKIADRLYARALEQSAGSLTCSTLVAVNNAAAFWQRLGYQTAVPETETGKKILASYGPDAVFMRRSLN